MREVVMDVVGMGRIEEEETVGTTVPARYSTARVLFTSWRETEDRRLGL
jgi:hypothetical protein